MGQAQGTDGRLLAGRYRLGDVLGKGGMGTVWRAEDTTLGRTVAVKELRFPSNIDEEERGKLITRTLREAKATARIRSTGAVTVFDVVEEDGRPWIVMELVEGRSLSDAIREDGPLTPKRAAEVGLTVLDVLRAAHREGILHRDVKPSNVLIGNDGRVVLSDFGIAQVEGDPSVTSTGMLVGAPSYISPERARGQKPGPPADLWSLGALLFASVEGRPPYDKGSALATLTAVMTEKLSVPKNAGPLADAIYGLLIKDPERRLDDAGVRGILTEVANAPDVPVTAVQERPRTTPLPPVDPQPTPTDAPAETREAAADQAALRRTRNALRSVRNAAGKPRSKPEQAPEPDARSAPPAVFAAERASGPKPNRALIAAIVLVVLTVLGAAIGVVLVNNGDATSSDSKRNSGKGATTAAASPSADGTATQEPATEPSEDSTTAKPKSPSASATATGTATGGVPDGYTTVTNEKFHHSMALPDGWKQTDTAGVSSGAIYNAKAGGFPRVQVDYSSQPGTDAAAAWRSAEPGTARSSTAYTLLGIEKVDYRNYRTAADWEFTRTQDGVKVRVLNRGFVVDDTHAYSIMFTAPVEDWNTAKVKKMRETFFETFKVVN